MQQIPSGSLLLQINLFDKHLLFSFLIYMNYKVNYRSCFKNRQQLGRES
jgi:hypothetical protein